ncbi:hypothetical protein, partial [Tritonibacter sp. SIMBA_163]|uniref:hypothetical protein n=1 Tax=Tritonibacter sp. SIMBA_163 TaxID=3080868 RepID=UPI00397FE5CC
IGEPTLIEVEPFTDDQIKDLVRAEYSIGHYLALDRIAELSRGNPRLAVMAAKLTKEEGTLQSIANIESLYDQYFSSIKDGWQEIGID